MSIIVAPSSENFFEYRAQFVQGQPKYTRKELNDETWKTVKRPLFDKVVKGHLEKRYSIGCVSKWYPNHLVLDFDNWSFQEIEEERDRLGLDDSNSSITGTESSDSYHIQCVPKFNGKPPTVKLLQSIIGPYAKERGFEVFPHPNKTIRLPFGPNETPLDENGSPLLNTWEDQLYWFKKLDEVNLDTLPISRQLILDFQPEFATGTVNKNTYQEGAEYLKYGLQMPSSREHAQFCIIHYLWGQNTTLDRTLGIVWKWIQNNHNGFSKEILRNPTEVHRHIIRQVYAVYGTFHHRGTYPDTPHKAQYGYIAKGDLEEIIKATGGNIPRARFLFELIKYTYPRRYRAFIGVHRDKLRSWAGVRSVNKFLNELEAKKLLKRGTAYQVGAFSKSITMNWKYGGESEAVLYEGRAIDTFEDTVKLLHGPEDFRAMLQGAGAKRTTAYESTRAIFK